MRFVLLCFHIAEMKEKLKAYFKTQQSMYSQVYMMTSETFRRSPSNSRVELLLSQLLFAIHPSFIMAKCIHL